MNVWLALLLIGVILLVGFAGVQVLNLAFLFGVIIPYAAMAVFLGGLVSRIVTWARSPEPFKIPTTCGQQKSLPWIKAGYLEAPFSTLGVVLRMALEILAFRSLFRNTRQETTEGGRLVYSSSKYLWLGALAFHYSFLVIFIRHYRFFAEPVPFFVGLLESFDGFFQVGVPPLLITDAVIVGAIGFLFLRRLYDPKLRYISLLTDYFALFLLLGIATTGILMRYFVKVDIVAVKKLTTGLMSFSPTIPEGINVMFYLHLVLVSALLIYFPFSKLLHFAGIFLSPTRNLPNNNRAVRYINPWNYPVKVHTYEEWESELKDKLVASGYELEKTDHV